MGLPWLILKENFNYFLLCSDWSVHYGIPCLSSLQQASIACFPMPMAMCSRGKNLQQTRGQDLVLCYLSDYMEQVNLNHLFFILHIYKIKNLAVNKLSCSSIFFLLWLSYSIAPFSKWSCLPFSVLAPKLLDYLYKGQLK